MKVEKCEEFYYRVTNVDNDIYKEFNTNKENVFRNNNNIKLYEGEWLKIKVNNFITHHVRPADTIKDIAKLYDIDHEKIINDNNLESSKLFIGQTLKIYK